MKFQERARFTEDGIEYVNVLQVESGYDRNLTGADWDADPLKAAAKIADFLKKQPGPVTVIPDVKPELEFTDKELSDALEP